MADTPLIMAARQWVIDNYPYNSNHLVKALDWVDRLAPGATEAVRLATLTHDMERAFPGPDQPVQEKIDGLWADDEYNKAHSARSARIVGVWLREQNADEALTQEVERLIIAHEIGGWPEANLVQAADSLSFLETNIDLFLNMARSGKRTIDEVMIKFYVTYERIQVPQARELGLPIYKAAQKLVRQCAEANGDNPPLTRLLLVSFSPPNSTLLAHDLRAPLNSIRGFADLIEEIVDGDASVSTPQVKEFAGRISSIAIQLLGYLEAYSQFERIFSQVQERRAK